ncbi:MAG: hypothetical protein AAF907_13405 [Planctomycetota bacterium]
MFRSARLRVASLRSAEGMSGRRASLAVGLTVCAISGCCSAAYGPYPYGTPGYYGQPYGGNPYGAPPFGAQPLGQPQFAPQPIPGTVQPGGTFLGAPSNGGVPALPSPDSNFPPGDFEELSPSDGFGDPPLGGSPDSGSPFYEGGNYGAPPTGRGSVPPLEDYETNPDAFDSPDPNGVENFTAPPPGNEPFEGFQDPEPDDFTGSATRPRAGLAATRLPRGPARPLLGSRAAPQFDPFVKPAGAAEPAPTAAADGPIRTVTGVVAHDVATNRWTLTYTMHPKATDRFGGALTLIDNGHLAGLEKEKNLIVSATGRLAQTAAPDALGKPRFAVQSVSERGYYEGP